ncbi:DUF6879 family protein [Streptomyces sparsogenes]|uniref:DUF6879 domain-containing protein n=1 Tax=Streptomyces sparsogenes DSM 40356 TaxID=1331668 RepID=A0A1R1S5T6_9ACTN|nr:DUF6879 family protein [Streptomyces sparsogenes]OMI33627.1 Hypothetical protein SPAR_40437 [Streptomyces sparsogenes DSM 40356]
MTSSSKTLGGLFDSFQREAFRLETLNDYSKSGSVDAYHAYLAGEPQPEDYNAGWVEELRSHTENGKRVYRVHILSRPLTDYLCFELGWGYRKNMTGGEEFFILDVTDKPNPLTGVPDFWCFDSESVAVMNYDGAGKYLSSEILEPERVAEFTRYRDTALTHAEPFTEWWAKYGA